MKPICISCHRFFRPKKNEFYFIEGMPDTNDTASGSDAGWSPYKLWCGDLWECEGCNTQIISGVGSQEIAEHFQPDFSAWIERTGAKQFQVNDC